MTKPFSTKFEEHILTLHDKGWAAHRIGKKFGKFTSSILRVLRKNNRKLNFVYQGKGLEHSQWKGGRSIHGQSGYWTVYAPEHPRRKNNNRVFEHIIVAEKKIGRSIPRSQPIHHIDFDRLNNNPDNLHVCRDAKEHMDIHYSLEEIARELFRRGRLGFRNGKYFWR